MISIQVCILIFLSGFDGSSGIGLISIKTEIAQYYLRHPSKNYKPIWQEITKKFLLLKATIEYLTDYPEATYEDLLGRLAELHDSSSYSSASENFDSQAKFSFNSESFLNHADFILQSVKSFDESGGDDDVPLLLTPALTTFAGMLSHIKAFDN